MTAMMTLATLRQVDWAEPDVAETSAVPTSTRIAEWVEVYRQLPDALRPCFWSTFATVFQHEARRRSRIVERITRDLGDGMRPPDPEGAAIVLLSLIVERDAATVPLPAQEAEAGEPEETPSPAAATTNAAYWQRAMFQARMLAAETSPA